MCRSLFYIIMDQYQYLFLRILRPSTGYNYSEHEAIGIVKTWPKDAVTLSCLRKCYGWSMLVIIYAQSGFPLFVYAADFGSRLDVWASWEAYKKDIKILGKDLLLYNPWEWFRLLLDILMYLQHFIIYVKHTWVWANRSRSAPKFCWKLCLAFSFCGSNRADKLLYIIPALFIITGKHSWVSPIHKILVE